MASIHNNIIGAIFMVGALAILSMAQDVVDTYTPIPKLIVLNMALTSLGFACVFFFLRRGEE